MGKYWEFKNKSDIESDLYLYSEIDSWGDGEYAHSAKSFKNELDALGDIGTLNIYINSPGGDVFEGVSIANMLKRKKCVKNIYIDGLAASIASVIAMAGDNVIMPSNSMMMIHNAWTFTQGNANDLRKMADDLEKMDSSIRQSYLDKSNGKIDEETLIDLMNKESWLSADECLEYGLCDEIVEANKMVAKLDPKLFKNYKNVPENLKGSFFIAQNQMDDEMKTLIKNIKENDWYKNTQVSKGGYLINEK